MTEAEWMASTDPGRMLAHLGDRASARKLRLFAVACCRAIADGAVCPACGGKKTVRPKDRDSWWPAYLAECLSCRGSDRVGGLTDLRSRRAVEVAERYADGQATDRERSEARATACWSNDTLPSLGQATCYRDETLLRGLRDELGRDNGVPPATQADLLRCVFGNPFQKPAILVTPIKVPGGYQHLKLDGHLVSIGESGKFILLPAEWLTANDGAVRKLAEAAYGEEVYCQKCGAFTKTWLKCPDCRGRGTVRGPFRPEVLGPLADALEEAGCHDADLLWHLRGPGPHARGCWPMDLLLGKS